MKMAVSSPKGKKKLMEEEKLLVTSNFSFSKTHKNQSLYQKWLSFGLMFNLSSANAFNLDKVKIVLTCEGLIM